MRAYKFLGPDGRSAYTGTAWSPGRWIVAATARPCREGVHAVTPRHLAYWIDASLWEIELAGEIAEGPQKIVATRGRLLGAIPRYTIAVRQLAVVGAWRSRDHAVAALRADAQAELADRLAQCESLDEIAAVASSVPDATFAGRAAALAADAAYFALTGRPAQAPFVAACAAAHSAAGPMGDRAAYDVEFANERDFQSHWLAARLELVEP